MLLEEKVKPDRAWYLRELKKWEEAKKQQEAMRSLAMKVEEEAAEQKLVKVPLFQFVNQLWDKLTSPLNTLLLLLRERSCKASLVLHILKQ